jgi:hypothetical protein
MFHGVFFGRTIATRDEKGCRPGARERWKVKRVRSDMAETVIVPAHQTRAIKLRRSWRRKPAGTVVEGLSIGIATDLVQRHRIADWADGSGQQEPAKNLNDFRAKKKARGG